MVLCVFLLSLSAVTLPLSFSFTLHQLTTSLWASLKNLGKNSLWKFGLGSFLQTVQLFLFGFLFQILLLCTFHLGVYICFCFALIGSRYLSLFTDIWMSESLLSEIIPFAEYSGISCLSSFLCFGHVTVSLCIFLWLPHFWKFASDFIEFIAYTVSKLHFIIVIILLK